MNENNSRIIESLGKIPNEQFYTFPDRQVGVLIFDLPRPPSVNRMTWRLGNKSPKVQRWIRAADHHLMSNPARWRNLQAKAIRGPFTAVITWDEEDFGHTDCDNPIKALLDYLQRIRLIENDRLCRVLMVTFGDAPVGCQVQLLPWRAQA
jgi:Holliday junction resolvase RusA-like endonuclease